MKKYELINNQIKSNSLNKHIDKNKSKYSIR